MSELNEKTTRAEWIGIGFTILATWGAIAYDHGTQQERIETLTKEYTDIRRDFDAAQRDQTIGDKLDGLSERLVRVETQLSGLSSDVKELKEKRR